MVGHHIFLVVVCEEVLINSIIYARSLERLEVLLEDLTLGHRGPCSLVVCADRDGTRTPRKIGGAGSQIFTMISNSCFRETRVILAKFIPPCAAMLVSKSTIHLFIVT